jgi:Fic family protein
MFRQGQTSGQYTSTSTASGEQVRAFIPHPLPPVPALILSGSRQRALEKATLALGRLDSITLLLPDPQLFLYAFIRREALYSSQIEGAQSSLLDLLLFELGERTGAPIDEVVEVSNCVAALEHGLARLRDGLPLCKLLLREMHTLLMTGGRFNGKDTGEFRRTQNWIGGTRPGNARFVPPPAHEVQACMTALEQFIQNNANMVNGRPIDDMPVLLKAALAHGQFETIHPFLDGNGRLGRLLIVLMLHDSGVLQQPLLYLSLYFKQHRALYDELLDRVRIQGDWEAWVDFFLAGVEQTANAAVQTAKQLAAMFAQDIQRANSAGRGNANVVRVLEGLRKRPLCSLRQLAKDGGISFPTASKAVLTLVDMGIARELTGQRRNRLFVYDAYLNLLNEGTEPRWSESGARRSEIEG